MNNLFALVHSLSKSEKRFFRLWSSRYKGEKNFLKLFGYIERMGSWDEAHLRFVIREKPLLKNLSFEKNNLYNRVVRFLALHSGGDSVDGRLQVMLRAAEVLYTKSLFDDCTAQVGKARRLAEEHERFSALLEILEWERRLLTDSYSPDRTRTFLEVMAGQARHYLAQSERNFRCRIIHDRVWAHVAAQGRTRSEEQIAELRKMVEEFLPDLEEDSLPYDARRFLLNACIAYHRTNGEHGKTRTYAAQLVEHLENHPHRVRENPASYFSALNNLLITQADLYLTGEFTETLRKLEQPDRKYVPKMTEGLAMQNFRYLYNVKLSGYVLLGKFSEGTHMGPAVEEGLKRFEGKISKSFDYIFYYNLAVLHYGNGSCREALVWLNKALAIPESEVMQDNYVFGRLFNVLLHYELGNSDLLEYIIRSTYRYLCRRNRLFSSESLFIRFLRQSQDAVGDREMKTLFARWKEELESLQGRYEQQAFLYYFDYVSWLESKISGRTFADVVQEKVKARTG